jgi:exportin-2 (importin alpha re-exporter)
LLLPALLVSGAGSARSSEDDGQEEILDAADVPGGYSAAYAKLANASMPERPVLAEIADPKQFAESRLASFISRMGSS